MVRYLVIAVGGALGSVVRYMLSGLVYRSSQTLFPVGTLFVNLSGSFVIGLLWGISERYMLSPLVRTFLFVGVLGGYTTFSTFALESYNLLNERELVMFGLNIALSVALGIVCIIAGLSVARALIKCLA